MEVQVTYPIVHQHAGGAEGKGCPRFSDFAIRSFTSSLRKGLTSIGHARETLEYLSAVLQRLPQGVRQSWVRTQLESAGSFSTPSWITAESIRSPNFRSLQDWFLRYQLKSVPGVAEVAPLGGFVRQYQVNVDPNRLQAYKIPIMKVVEAVRNGNNDVGGRLVEFSGTEYMVRGRGYAKSVDDIGNIVLLSTEGGVPVRVKDVGNVVLGPDIRRGIADWNGEGDVVSGIVVMRQGENALDVIERVKARSRISSPACPME